MDGNDFFLEILVRDRLAEARAEVARQRLAASAPARPGRLAAYVARALARLARRRPRARYPANTPVTGWWPPLSR